MARALPGIAGAPRALAQHIRDTIRLVKRQTAAPHGRRTARAPQDLRATAYSGPVRHASRRAGATPLPARPGSLPVVGGVSAGLSGGANPAGTLLALDRWRDLGILMGSLNIDFFVSTACRLLPGADLERCLPEFPFVPHGPRTAQYGAVCGFSAQAGVPAHWLQSASDTERISWFAVGPALIVGGFISRPRAPRRRLRLGGTSS